MRGAVSANSMWISRSAVAIVFGICTSCWVSVPASSAGAAVGCVDTGSETGAGGCTAGGGAGLGNALNAASAASRA